MRNLILIDNNKDDLQFMKEALASADDTIQCLSFVYSEEAMKAMMNNVVEKPEAVFMNLNMPRRNGIQCLMELRGSAAFASLPVVLYASKITSDVVDTLKGSGNTLIFEKPKTIVAWKKIMSQMLTSIDRAEGSFRAHFANTSWFVH